MPAIAHRRAPRRPSRRVVAFLALLIALQALAAALLATLGPMHTHRGEPAVVVLDDVRRGPALRAGGDARAAAARHGHSHVDAASLRHLHAPGDAGVVLADGEAASHADDAGAALGALVGLVADSRAWVARDTRDVAATRRLWVPQVHHPELPERPPRTA